ncbi:hypothetical protein PM082_009314 [Marasmius tenuissimus]|nr:hypothetical protein PM082_009314 [Marasmius tenuissimus]
MVGDSAASFEINTADLVERFKAPSDHRFHLELLPSNNDDSPSEDALHYALLASSGCAKRPSYMLRGLRARLGETTFPFHLTECRCENHPIIESAYPPDSGSAAADPFVHDRQLHRTYQEACLRTTKSTVSHFRSALAAYRWYWSSECRWQVVYLFENIVGSSLFQNCRFDDADALFPLCEDFFSSAMSCLFTLALCCDSDGYLAHNKYRLRLLDWIKAS